MLKLFQNCFTAQKFNLLFDKTIDSFTDGILMELFLDVVKNGAEAMDWDGQDPPKSYGNLEGAWWVWKKGGSASPMVGDEDED